MHASNDCGPCADPALSRVSYGIVLSGPGLDLLGRAVVGGDPSGVAAFRGRFSIDTTRATPRVIGTVFSTDTLAAWRAALERYGREAPAAGDSAGAVGLSVLAALDRAAAHPQQPLTPMRGTLVRDAAGVHVTGCTPPVAITGPGADSLATAAGADVWFQGHCGGPVRMEWVGGHAIGPPRIDLFVMGLCPYARRLEGQMHDDLAKFAPGQAPLISVHYLLYWDDEGPIRRVGSSHGERERVEDGVQILIRDEHPAAFWRYLWLRSQAEVPWEILAQKSGLSWQDIGSIQRRVARDLDTLLTREHEWNQANYPHIAGSPTVYWSGAPVQSIAQVPGFSAPPHEEEKCSGEAEEKTAAP